MSVSKVSRTLVLVPVLWALVLVPAAAQERRAKDGWDLLRNSLTEAGLRVRAEGITHTGSGLVVNGVTIAPMRGGALLSLPSLGVEPREAEGYAFIPSQEARLELDGAGVVNLEFDGQVLFDRLPEGLRLAPDFTRIEAHLDGAAGSGRATVQMRLDAVGGEITTQEGAQLTLNSTLRAGQMHMRQTWDYGHEHVETSEIDEVVVGLRVDALDALSSEFDTVAALFERGFALDLNFEAAASRNSSRQAPEGSLLIFDSTSGYTDSNLTLRDGRVEARGSGADMQVVGNVAGIEGQLAIDRLQAAFGLPLVATEDLQDFGLSLSVDGMQASEESWLLLGARTFADESADMVLEMAAEGRWLVDPALAEGSSEPIELAAIRLDQLALRLGQAHFEGEGRFDADRQAGGIEQAMEMGQGAFTFTLRGGNALLARLIDEGVLPADQAFLVRMMLGGMARQVGEDHLESQVTIMPGGQVLVNGMPLPF